MPSVSRGQHGHGEPGALARPRDISEVKLDPLFHELHRDIWHKLKAEVVKGYAQAEGG